MAQKMQYIMPKLKGVERPAALSKLNMLKGIRLTSRASRLAVILISALVAGCVGPQKGVKQRFFWPPLPDTPRIEWLAAYSSQLDFPKEGMEGFLRSVAGEEAMRLAKPWGIVSAGDGRVFVVDSQLAAVYIFDMNRKTVQELGKGEYSDLFAVPLGIALDPAGNIYVSDTKKNRVFVFDKDEKPLTAIGDDKTVNWPVGMAISGDRLYVANSHGHNISVFDTKTGSHLFSIGSRGGGNGEFNYPTDVAVDSNGNIVVADSMNARIQILDREGKFIRKFGQRGDGNVDFQIIKGVAVDRSDNIYVTDGKANKIIIFNQQGEPLLVIGGPHAAALKGKLFPGGFLLPQDIFIDRNETIYVVDQMNRMFQVFQVVNEEWLKKNPIEK